MSATWDEHDGSGWSFRKVLLVSAIAHAVLLLFLAVSPSFSSAPSIPDAITVDLLAPPGPPPAAKSGPKAKAAAPKAIPAPPAPKAAPEPVPPPPQVKPAPPPPPPTAAKVLPKEATKAPEAVKPAPPPPAAMAPTPVAKPAPPARQQNIDDVMAQLRAEAGEESPAPVEEARLDASDVAGTGGGGGSVQVSPEVMAWLKSARIHVRRSWVLQPGFRLEPLSTQVRVNLDAAGNVVGEPEVIRRSGNPWYDESVLRAIQKASPLPAPPRAGAWDFLFKPEES